MGKRTVNSSNGIIVIDDQGKVIVSESTYYPVAKGDLYPIANIMKFDLAEYRKAYPDAPEPGSYDILDLGYWMRDGKYEPPDYDWRSTIAQDLMGRQPVAPKFRVARGKKGKSSRKSDDSGLGTVR